MECDEDVGGEWCVSMVGMVVGLGRGSDELIDDAWPVSRVWVDGVVGGSVLCWKVRLGVPGSGCHLDCREAGGQLSHRNTAGKNALMVASNVGNKEMVKCLLDQGAGLVYAVGSAHEHAVHFDSLIGKTL